MKLKLWPKSWTLTIIWCNRHMVFLNLYDVQYVWCRCTQLTALHFQHYVHHVRYKMEMIQWSWRSRYKQQEEEEKKLKESDKKKSHKKEKGNKARRNRSLQQSFSCGSSRDGLEDKSGPQRWFLQLHSFSLCPPLFLQRTLIRNQLTCNARAVSLLTLELNCTGLFVYRIPVQNPGCAETFFFFPARLGKAQSQSALMRSSWSWSNDDVQLRQKNWNPTGSVLETSVHTHTH